MPRPRQISDDAILHAVRRAVLELGPQVSMDRVAEQLGVTAPALFHRFGSRDDLLIAALRPGDPPFLRRLDDGPDERPIFEQLCEVFMRLGEWVAESLPCLSALRESGVTFEQCGWGDDPPPLRIASALGRWLDRARRRHLLRVDDVNVTATAILGAIQAPVFLRYIAKQQHSWPHPELAAQAFTRLFLAGLAPDPSSPASQKRRSKERS